MTKALEPTIPRSLITHLRKLAPKRALSYGESFVVAQHQATLARELLSIQTPAMPLDWVPELPRTTVELLPAHELGETVSGLTTKRDGQYLIMVNKNNSRNHRRWTLAHELKHLIDYPYARILHAGLGYGDVDWHDRQVERIADHFAAHLLMPTKLVKRAWGYGVQDRRTLSRLFRVSEEAMQIRLRHLGLTGDDEQPVAAYFRRTAVDVSWIPEAA